MTTYHCPFGHVLVNWTGGPCWDAEGNLYVRVMACVNGCGGQLYGLSDDRRQVVVEPYDPTVF